MKLFLIFFIALSLSNLTSCSEKSELEKIQKLAEQGEIEN